MGLLPALGMRPVIGVVPRMGASRAIGKIRPEGDRVLHPLAKAQRMLAREESVIYVGGGYLYNS